jgi:hypothetical protein
VITILRQIKKARWPEPKVDSWMLLAENAALGAYTVICGDGPVLPKELGQQAEKGGEPLAEWSAQGGGTIEGSKISGGSGRAGGQVSAAGVRSSPAGIVSKDSRTVPT